MALLTSIGFSIIAFLFVLGVMIFIHELGHHIAANYWESGWMSFPSGLAVDCSALNGETPIIELASCPLEVT